MLLTTQKLRIKVKFSPKELHLNSLFEKRTLVQPRMTLNFEDAGHIFFFVNSEDFQRAIGANFKNLQVLHETCKKRVHIIKFSPDPVKLMKFCLPSIQVNNLMVKINGQQREMIIHVDPVLKGVIRGAGGHYLQLLTMIFSRLFKIAKISIDID